MFGWCFGWFDHYLSSTGLLGLSEWKRAYPVGVVFRGVSALSQSDAGGCSRPAHPTVPAAARFLSNLTSETDALSLRFT